MANNTPTTTLGKVGRLEIALDEFSPRVRMLADEVIREKGVGSRADALFALLTELGVLADGVKA